MRYLILMIVVVLVASCVSQTTSFEKGMQAFATGDYAEAKKHMLTLAEKGDAAAQLNMGILYTQGFGVVESHAEALKWYCQAAAGGEPGAFTNIGEMYLNGMGLAKDQNLSSVWYRKAAELDGPIGQFRVGWNYYKGEQEQKDLYKAYVLFKLAFRNFNDLDRELAMLIGDLEQELTPQQISAGVDAVKAWEPTPFSADVVQWVQTSDACRATLRAEQQSRATLRAEQQSRATLRAEQQNG